MKLCMLVILAPFSHHTTYLVVETPAPLRPGDREEEWKNTFYAIETLLSGRCLIEIVVAKEGGKKYVTPST